MPQPIIDTRRLHIFMTVAEELHFRHAAKRLNMSQPPVSMAVRSLEEDLGVTLLERSTRRVTLTGAGRALKEEGEGLLEALHRLEEKVKHASEGTTGTLSIGFVGIAMSMGLADHIRQFRTTTDRVNLRLEEASPLRLLQDVDRGLLDIAFVRALEKPQTTLPTVLIKEESYWLALPNDHHLAREEAVPLCALDEEPILFFPRRFDPVLHDRWLEIFATEKIAPRRVQEVRSLQTELGLVRAGVGLSLVSESVAKMQSEGVVFRPLLGHLPKVRLFAVWRGDDAHEVRDRFLNVATNDFKS